jgi:predicted DNA-binding transcriptional regulator AlpA
MKRKIMRLPEIEERTGIPIATLRWYRHQGIGPRTFVLARRVVAYEDEVESWIAAQAAAESRRVTA